MPSFDEVKLEDILHCSFATFNPDTGANKDADSLPTAVVYEEGNSTALVSTVTVTNITTGRYRLQVAVAAADGYEAGKFYELWVSATVTGSGSPVTQAAPLVSFKATEKVVDDLNTIAPDNASIAAILEDTGTTIPALITTLNSRLPGTIVERTISDTNDITFAWPVSGATITGEVSLNNAAYVPIGGAIAFLRTEEDTHYYTLAYDADDRPATEGVARYKLDDGTYTRFVNLRVAPADATAASQTVIANAIAALNDLSASAVNDEILDVLNVDLFGELAAPPDAESSLKDKLTWLFMWARNKATETALERKLFADDNVTVVSTESVTDDNITFTKTKAI